MKSLLDGLGLEVGDENKMEEEKENNVAEKEVAKDEKVFEKALAVKKVVAAPAVDEVVEYML